MHEAEEASQRSRIRSIILSGCDSECSYAMLCMAMFISRGLVTGPGNCYGWMMSAKDSECLHVSGNNVMKRSPPIETWGGETNGCRVYLTLSGFIVLYACH